ncbi:hypothetical protein HCN44_007775 [Aphidius gifuensis]|uniref:Uncharacterized protein n=1 Tax=Aphidius gifuensis TaxID=684658 RepID=A0A834XJC7_APHGI|nr:hypothetical protein HCN44_007775 [Aphidius gifuensis]
MVSNVTAVLNENDQVVCSCSDDEDNNSTLSFSINNSQINPYEELAITERSRVKFDPRKGFIITNPRYINAPVDFTCSITLDGRTEIASQNVGFLLIK